MLPIRRLGKIGVYGTKTRLLQRRLSYEAFGLTFKTAIVWRYIGSKDSLTPDINDVSTKVFWEVPDRAYHEVAVAIPIGMEPMQDIKADFSRFGYIDPLQNENLFRVHIDDFQELGRELIVGDVFEMPFFQKDGKKVFWEISDVDLKSEYEKFIAIIHASPLGDARKSEDIQVEQSNEFLLDDLMIDADEEYSEQVPIKGLTDDFDPEPEDIDYRNENQRSFLDDPTKFL
ncbi:hypothetical protein [Alishewanella phage vB_AspM_Slicko01]|nr:hypothetical protein [Alishewanella phage vB_AspM_Slicko01]